ncbi:MAG: peptidylprolyl isomerase [Gemmatimonadota bacterium]
MRRLLLLALLVSVAGCDTGAEAKGDPAVAAEAAGQRFTSDQLSDFLTLARSDALEPALGDFVARVWVDYTLFAQAALKGETFVDSATVTSALALPLRQVAMRLWHDTLGARRPPLPTAAADSIYARDSVRVLQHILLRLPDTSGASEVQQLRRKADSLLNLARAGVNFAELARAHSNDASGARGGYLPPRPKGSFVQPFDQIAWQLKPGEVSGLIVTPFGVHIARRPLLDEVREILLADLARQAMARADSMHVDSLLAANGYAARPFAADTMRAIVAGRTPATGSTTVVLAFRDGGVTRADLEQELGGLPPELAGQLAAAPDSQLKLLAREVAAAVLLNREAEASGIRVPDSVRVHLAEQYRAEVRALRQLLGVDAVLREPDKPAAAKAEELANRVNRLMRQFASGEARYIPLPQGLASILRNRYPHTLSPAGIARATEAARQAHAKADTARGGADSAGGRR